MSVAVFQLLCNCALFFYVQINHLFLWPLGLKPKLAIKELLELQPHAYNLFRLCLCVAERLYSLLVASIATKQRQNHYATRQEESVINLLNMLYEYLLAEFTISYSPLHRKCVVGTSLSEPSVSFLLLLLLVKWVNKYFKNCTVIIYSNSIIDWT